MRLREVRAGPEPANQGRAAGTRGRPAGQGMLPEVVERASDEAQLPRMREPRGQRAVLDAERLRRLEQENASLRSENAELKRLLERHAVLREALALTGRLPR